MVDNTITDIINIDNKSGKNKLLIEIECEKNPQSVLFQLYKETDLQKSFSANQFALVGKTPKLLNLKQYFDIFIKHNIECINNEYKYELEKAKDRLEIVEGLLKALEDIDNIITLIKQSDSATHAVTRLVEKYKMSERQAKAIVDMKLGRLAKLEKIELEQESSELKDKINNCEIIINDEEKKKNIFLERIKNFTKKYGFKRRTELTHIEEPKTREEKEVALIPPEKCVVVMTDGGSLKRISATAFKAQRRGGKGVKTQDDITSVVIRTNTVDSLMIFTNKGKMYRLTVNNIPEGTNTSRGTPVRSLIEMEKDENVQTIYSIYRDTDAKYVLFVTKKGMVKKTSLEEFIGTKKSKGIGAINIKEGDALSVATLIKDEQLLLFSKKGYVIRFDSSEISPSGRAAMGVKGINLTEDDELIAALPIRHNTDNIAIFTNQGYGKRVSLNEIPLQKRAGKGVIIYKPNDIGGQASAAQLVVEDDIVLIVGNKKSICLSANEISLTSRTAIGVIVLKGNEIQSVSKV